LFYASYSSFTNVRGMRKAAALQASDMSDAPPITKVSKARKEPRPASMKIASAADRDMPKLWYVMFIIVGAFTVRA
jgi:hypothetical protein